MTVINFIIDKAKLNCIVIFSKVNIGSLIGNVVISVEVKQSQ